MKQTITIEIAGLSKEALFDLTEAIAKAVKRQTKGMIVRPSITVQDGNGPAIRQWLAQGGK